jgi:DNA topoisomerase VI subunit B
MHSEHVIDYRKIDSASSAPPADARSAPTPQQSQLNEIRTINAPEISSLERIDYIAIPTASQNTAEVSRGPEVTDETWAQLQKDKMARELELDRLDREILGKERDVDWAEQVEEEAVEVVKIIQEQIEANKEEEVQLLVKRAIWSEVREENARKKQWLEGNCLDD